MKPLSSLLLISFLSLALFGFLGMSDTYSMAHAPNQCLASLAQNGACPPEENTVASAVFHTNALKVFTTTLLTVSLVLLAAAVLFLAFVKPAFAVLERGAETATERLQYLVSHYLGIRRLRLALVRLETSPTLY